MNILKKIKQLILGEKVNYEQKILNGAILLDVRTIVEFNSGNAIHSINIPLDQLKNRLTELGEKEIIVVCKSGVRAASAKALLTRKGIIAFNAGSWTRFQ